MKTKKQIRKLFDIKEVIYDRKWLSSSNNIELYYIYREFYFSTKDLFKMKQNGLRYDITFIPPRMLGCEFVKTAGHYHSMVSGTDITFPEIYEVLAGEANFMLQKLDNDKIKDVILIEVRKGDKVIIPPGYGHLTINKSDKVFKMANWIALRNESIYSPIVEKGGGAYFFLIDGLVKNSKYANIPEIRIMKPFDLEIGLKKGEYMYDLVKDIKKLEFLTKPQEYMKLFEELYPI